VCSVWMLTRGMEISLKVKLNNGRERDGGGSLQ